jgi:hypothetical protein
MYEEIAKQWIEEMQENGKIGSLRIEEINRLVTDYAHRIEEIFEHEVSKQMEYRGKADEYERMKLYDTQYMSKYLNQAIPGFLGFKVETFAKARKIILGECD